MGLFSWLFGGDKKAGHATMGAGTHQMQPAAAPMAAMHAGSGMHEHHSGAMSGMNMAKDPVCGMDVDPEGAAATSVYQGTTYYFCAPGCKKSFDKNPSSYLAGSEQMESGHPKGMHGGKHGGCC